MDSNKEKAEDIAGEDNVGNGETTEQKSHDINIKNQCSKFLKSDEKNKNEELLGSVTTSDCPGVRTSARVIQKMKQDSIRSVTPPPNDKKEISKDDKTLQKTPNQTKQPKVIWTNCERSIFFDALNEYGKDFEAIANYINIKVKKSKNANSSNSGNAASVFHPNNADLSMKTKEQVRQIYYQTFHKISKFIKFSDEVKKPIQELYALINYGEMRRKLIFVSEKNCRRIKELVYKGYMVVRSKGKNVRIKTPTCKALRNLNQLEEWQEDIKLPSKIEVVLKPASMEAWGRVQTLAQNPIVKTVLPLQKKLINVIRTFQHRWRSREIVLNEHALKLISSTTSGSKPKAEPKSLHMDNENLSNDLYMSPSHNVTIHRPLVSVNEFLSTFNICLNAYEQKLGVKTRGEVLCEDFSSVPNKRQRMDSGGCEKRSPESKKAKIDCDIRTLEPIKDVATIDYDLNDIQGINEEFPHNEEEIKDDIPHDGVCTNGYFTKGLEKVDGTEVDLNLRSDASTGSCDPNDRELTTVAEPNVVLPEAPSVNVVKPPRKKRKEKKENNNAKPLINDEVIRKIRHGWTMEDANDITIGDLYIMFGKDSKIMLEYDWRLREINKHENFTVPYNNLSINNNDSCGAHAKSENEFVNNIKSSSTLGSKLKHLLIIANLSERIKKKPCNCNSISREISKQKKLDQDSALRSYVSNKTFISSHKDYGLFRQPIVPFRRNVMQLDSLKQIQNGARTKARFLRHRSIPTKQIVVQRLLPLQPGTSGEIKSLSETDLMKAVQQKPHPQPELPSLNANENKNEYRNENKEEYRTENKEEYRTENKEEYHTAPPTNNSLTFTASLHPRIDNDLNGTSEIPNSTITSQSFPISKSINLDEDTGIRQLMDISLPSPIHHGSLDDSVSFDNMTPMSPMRILRESGDSKWLEANMNDFSLSSFLGHLEEMNQSDSTIQDGSNISIMSETTVDYISRFGELASIQDDDKN